MRVVLLKLHLMFTDDLGVLIKDDEPRTGRPAIHTSDKFSLFLFTTVHQVVHPAHPEALAPERSPDERASSRRRRGPRLGGHQWQRRGTRSGQEGRRSRDIDRTLLPVCRVTSSDDGRSRSGLVRMGERPSSGSRSAGERAARRTAFVDGGERSESERVAVSSSTGLGSPRTGRPLHTVLPQRRRGVQRRALHGRSRMILILVQLLLKPLHRGISLQVGHGCLVVSRLLAVAGPVVLVTGLARRSGSSVRYPSG